MKRLEQIVLIAAMVGLSWLGMQAVHEWGHVLGAAASGGRVTKVVLHPCAISRTDVRPNPHPLFVVWAGAGVGAVLPLLAWFAARGFRVPGAYLFRFFAGFCLVANGFYIGLGSIAGVADAGDMLRHGSARWQLILFGLAAAAGGLALWHGLGAKFGLGEAKGRVSRAAAVVAAVLLVTVVAVELATGSA